MCKLEYLNTGLLFEGAFDLELRPISELFLNNDIWSSYLQKFALNSWNTLLFWLETKGKVG